MTDSFTERVKKILKNIPPGKVSTYGRIAAQAGNPLAARQVVRILHACSDKDKLPWHRVVNSKGFIALARGRGFELQRALLKDEGVKCGPEGAVDLATNLWRPNKNRKT
ncbi:MAG: MGMT family protein [Candidatus Zixiibacteriota bacterium]